MKNSNKPGRDRDHFAAQSSSIKGYRLFRILGFEVKLNLTWLLLALLITWTLAEGFFPTDYPGLAVPVYFGLLISGVWLMEGGSIFFPFVGFAITLFGVVGASRKVDADLAGLEPVDELLQRTSSAFPVEIGRGDL